MDKEKGNKKDKNKWEEKSEELISIQTTSTL